MSDRCTATKLIQCCAENDGHTGHSEMAQYWDDGDPGPRIEITDAMKERGVKALQSAWRMPDDATVLLILEAVLNGDSESNLSFKDPLCAECGEPASDDFHQPGADIDIAMCPEGTVADGLRCHPFIPKE